MILYIKNNDSVQNTWVGQTFNVGEYIQIPPTDFTLWSNDSTLLVAVANGDAVVAKDDTGNEDITDISVALNFLKGNFGDSDPSGREVIRFAATVKGWHYQFHSIDLSTCQVDSVVNVDVDGTDLGFATLKIYKADGTECSDQQDADANGVKSVLIWDPGFDFEIISGNIRQESKQAQDIRMFTIAKIATGAPAPHNWFPVSFVEGGLNLKYIGADEILKTDGRASKLLKGSNGDHFEITLKHPAGVKHQLSVVFEIYKDPTS